VTTFPKLAESCAFAALLCACGAKTDLHRDGPKGLPHLPECTEEGALRECQSICGLGQETCFGGRWRFCSAEEPRPPHLEAVVRDFRASHPDFEPTGEGYDPGIVAFDLGPDDKPVYASATSTRTTSGAANFDTWYRDVNNVDDALNSIRLDTQIELMPSPRDPDLFVYENSAFFPIDGEGYGDEGNPHNYHFTLEVSTAFRYKGGETFSFTGDDDLWVFINRRLAIDLGGVHASMSDVVRLDDDAKKLGLERGQVYPLHLFFAERHVYGSNFNVSTTIAEFELCK
jgi:fibro-slime domain-containing protein